MFVIKFNTVYDNSKAALTECFSVNNYEKYVHNNGIVEITFHDGKSQRVFKIDDTYNKENGIAYTQFFAENSSGKTIDGITTN